MLDVFREGAKSWISKFFIWGVAFTFVAAAFVVWGQQGAQKMVVAAAVVGDEEITRAALFQRSKAIENNLRTQLGGKVDPEFLKTLDPRAMALDALIEEALMRRAAREAGVDVTDKETIEAVMGMREFITDGVFDRRKYNDILQLNGYTPGDFEAGVRQDILTSKLRSLIKRTVRVSDAEALDAYLRDNQQVVVAYAEAREENLRDKASADEAEVKDWYSKRQLDFEIPPKRKFRLITVNKSTFELSASVTEKEAREYFEQHTSEFEGSEAVEASHILVKVSMDSTEDSVRAAREKIDKAHARVAGGEDFSAVAKEMSEDSTASNGGALGRFTRGQMVQAFEDVVFAQKPEEVSAPFRTTFGWHVAKVTRKIEAGVPEFSQVEGFARIQAKKSKAAEEARVAIEKAAENATVENFTQIAGADSKLRFESFTLARNEAIPDTDDSERIMDVVFAMDKGKVSDVISTDQGYALVALDEMTDATVPPLEEVRSQVLARFVAEKSRQMSREIAEKIETDVRDGGKTFAEAVAAAGLEVKTTKPFSSNSLRGAQDDRDPGAVSEAFLMDQGEVKSVAGLKGFMAIMLVSRQPIDYAEAANQIEKKREEMLIDKRDRALAQVVARMREKAQAEGLIDIFAKLEGDS